MKVVLNLAQAVGEETLRSHCHRVDLLLKTEALVSARTTLVYLKTTVDCHVHDMCSGNERKTQTDVTCHELSLMVDSLLLSSCIKLGL